MKQVKPVQAPARTQLTALTQQDLGTVAGGGNGTVLGYDLLSISGVGPVSQGISGSGKPHG